MVTAAGIYARISRDRTGEQLGVTRQRQDCEALAERLGWPVAGTYVDDDVSAYSKKRRPEYTRMLDDIQAGTIDAVVCWHEDRLYRRMRDLVEFLDLVDRYKVRLANVNGDIDLSTGDGLFRAQIMAAVAEKESADKSRRLRRKHEELARVGKVANGGSRPFGFEPNRHDVRAEEADLIREAAKRLLSGEGTIAIAADWNRRGIKTSRDVQWLPTTLKRLMVNPRLAGLRTHHGEVVGPACWEAILDHTTHERLRGLLMDSSRSRPGPRRRYLLTGGIARCGLCGYELIANPSRSRTSYWCPASLRYGGCGKIRIDGAALEDEVRERVLTALAGPALTRALEAAVRDDDESTRVTERLAADEAALEELARDFYTDRLISKAEFLAARQALEARIEASRRHLRRDTRAGVLTDLPTDEEGLRATWDAHEVDWRRAAVGAVVDRVLVHPVKRRGSTRFDPGRVEVIWRV